MDAPPGRARDTRLRRADFAAAAFGPRHPARRGAQPVEPALVPVWQLPALPASRRPRGRRIRARRRARGHAPHGARHIRARGRLRCGRGLSAGERAPLAPRGDDSRADCRARRHARSAKPLLRGGYHSRALLRGDRHLPSPRRAMGAGGGFGVRRAVLRAGARHQDKRRADARRLLRGASDIRSWHGARRAAISPPAHIRRRANRRHQRRDWRAGRANRLLHIPAIRHTRLRQLLRGRVRAVRNGAAHPRLSIYQTVYRHDAVSISH